MFWGVLFCFFVVEVFAPCVFIGRQFLLLVFFVLCGHRDVLMVYDCRLAERTVTVKLILSLLRPLALF